ncbi:MAG: GNAT family N-acetyltransferase [Planctomycetes bacterium]|nr:GNAT family N-acetyltransferase [Planctomycetota bacterium]
MSIKVIPFKLKYIRDILAWIKTEPDMVQWAGPAFTWPMTQKQFRKHIQAGKKPPLTLYPFALINHNSVVGYCELSRHCRNSNQAMLSRVLIMPKIRNHGMATFLINEVLCFGFKHLNLNRIGLGVFDFNEAAIRCYSKTGFSLEGTLRESAKVGDSYWNCHLMSILRKEWKC